MPHETAEEHAEQLRRKSISALPKILLAVDRFLGALDRVMEEASERVTDAFCYDLIDSELVWDLSDSFEDLYLETAGTAYSVDRFSDGCMIRAKIRRLARLSSETFEHQFYIDARRRECEDQGFSDIVLHGEGREHAACNEILSLAQEWLSEGTGLWIARGAVNKASDELLHESITPEPAHTADAHQDGDSLVEFLGELDRRDAESATGEARVSRRSR